MRKDSGVSSTPPLALVHAGARPYQDAPELLAARNAALRDALRAVWPQILEGLPAVDAATALVACLEAAPSCNAGCGAALQRDGLARLSASLMSGGRQKFSGVALATHIVHPSRLARALQDREESVLGPLGAQLLARELGIPRRTLPTPRPPKSGSVASKRRAARPSGAGRWGPSCSTRAGRSRRPPPRAARR